MTDPLVKICGLTRMDDARLAADGGADILGLVFSKRSKRRVSIDTARQVSSIGKDIAGVYTSMDEIGDEIRYLDYIQLHFRHSITDIQKVKEMSGLKTISVVASLDPDIPGSISSYRNAGTDYVLLELVSGFRNYHVLASGIAERFEIGLSGRISVDDLPAVKKLRTTIIDASSSIEIEPGIKDHEKLARYLKEAKN